MKLLFDQNLSPRLPDLLAGAFPDASHVYLLGLDRASDEAVWAFARDNGYVIVTKDADFGELNVLRGFPPKVVWVRLGNCTTGQVAELLLAHIEDLKAFYRDPEAGLLTLLPRGA